MILPAQKSANCRPNGANRRLGRRRPNSRRPRQTTATQALRRRTSKRVLPTAMRMTQHKHSPSAFSIQDRTWGLGYVGNYGIRKIGNRVSRRICRPFCCMRRCKYRFRYRCRRMVRPVLSGLPAIRVFVIASGFACFRRLQQVPISVVAVGFAFICIQCVVYACCNRIADLFFCARFFRTRRCRPVFVARFCARLGRSASLEPNNAAVGCRIE